MAGKDIYIGSMLEKLQDSLNALETNIAESADAQIKKLNEVANIMNNVLINTGMTKSQKAFKGVELSAISLISPTVYNANLTNYSYFTAENTVTVSTGSVSAAIVKKVRVYYDIDDLKNKGYSSLRLSTSACNTYYSAELYINDAVVFSGKTAQALNIDITSYNGLIAVDYAVNKAKTGNNATYNVTFSNICFTGDNIENYYPHVLRDTLRYNNDILCMASSDHGSDAIGYLKPTVDNVAIWDSLIFIGSFSGVKLSIIDANENEILSLLPQSNISELSIFDFYIKIEMTDPLSYISSIIFRYF